ncbi:MAG TPA: acyl-CoA reductase [Flavobacteriaceae bacterium]|nr:acyl-CoA reductase [Flavobacteriaceae bacterium]
MSNIDHTHKTLTQLGDFLSQFSREEIKIKEHIPYNSLFFEPFQKAILSAESHNGWFTKENVLFAIEQWANALTDNNINTWISKYSFNAKIPKKVAVIMAGNLPLVGFHDFISVLISGHEVLIKQSSGDNLLLPVLVKYLQALDESLIHRISFTEGKLENFDAVIATGSNNTARYFEYYFRDKPAIIRKNRNSVAVLSGNETHDELKALSDDIFRYYGLGCRNVSKLFVPEGYNFNAFFEAIYHWHPIINETKYANNYDYNKAVYLMSEFNLLENGFLMLKEDPSYSSPIASVFYEFYSTKDALKNKVAKDAEQIQCIVAKGFLETEIAFGETQKPKLWEYADNVDTLDFLLKI